jgi:hypothetical protein
MSAIDKVFPILSGTFGNRVGRKSQEDYGPTVTKLLTSDEARQDRGERGEAQQLLRQT